MSVKSRIDRLERATGGKGDDGYCQCPGSGGMVWADSGEPVTPFVDDGRPVPPVPEDPCSKCGKPRQVIVLTWADDARDWEANPAVSGVVAIGGLDLERDL